MSGWDYSELSKAAKEAGGPEALTELLIQTGKEQMIPWIGAAGLLGAGIGYFGCRLTGYFRKRKEVSKMSTEAACRELVKGIREYDATQATPENDL